MSIWIAAGSLAAVLALAGFAWALGFGRRNIDTEMDATDLFADLLPDFKPGSIWVSHDRKTAIAINTARVAVLRSHGTRFVALNLPRSAVSRTGPDDFVIETGDRTWQIVSFGAPAGIGNRLQSALDSITDNNVSN